MEAQKAKLSEIIKRHRIAQHLTQDELVKEVQRHGFKITQPTLNRYEAGQNDRIQLEVIAGICLALGLNLPQILKEAGYPSESENGRGATLSDKERVVLSYLRGHPEILEILFLTAGGEPSDVSHKQG